MEIIKSLKYKTYYLFDNYKKRSRIGMPAIEFEEGYREWYFKGLFHRINGQSKNRVNKTLYKKGFYFLYEKPINLNITKLVI